MKMPHEKMTRRNREALRAALKQGQPGPSSQEAAASLHALAPRLDRAARRLAGKRAERRAVRLQALGLAGCSVLFAALAGLAYQCRAFLLARPERWGLLLAFGIVALLVVGCMPILLKKEEGVN
jgi:hypothetical protein